jgi:hypothetical protein
LIDPVDRGGLLVILFEAEKPALALPDVGLDPEAVPPVEGALETVRRLVGPGRERAQLERVGDLQG